MCRLRHSHLRLQYKYIGFEHALIGIRSNAVTQTQNECIATELKLKCHAECKLNDDCLSSKIWHNGFSHYFRIRLKRVSACSFDRHEINRCYAMLYTIVYAGRIGRMTVNITTLYRSGMGHTRICTKMRFDDRHFDSVFIALTNPKIMLLLPFVVVCQARLMWCNNKMCVRWWFL